MNRLVRQYQSLLPKEKQAFWLSFVLALAMSADSLISVPKMSLQQDTLSLVAYLLPIILGVLFITSTVLIFIGKSYLGGIVYMVSTTIAGIILPLLVQGLGFFVAAIYFVIGIYFVSLIFSNKTSRWYPYAAGIVAILAILVDYFWPFQRHTLSAQSITIVQFGSIGLLVISLVFIWLNFRNFSIVNKLAIFSLVLALIPMAFVGIIANRNAQSVLTKNADDSLNLAASQAASNLDAFFDYNLDAIRTEAQYPEMAVLLEMAPQDRAGSAAEANVLTTLSTLVRKSPVFVVSYGLLDENGLVLVDTSPDEIGRDWSQRSFFIEAVNSGLPSVSDIEYSEFSSFPSIYFTAPLRNDLGEIIGVLRATYNAGVIQQLLTQQSNFKYSDFFGLVVSQNNLIIANNDFPEEIYKSIIPLTQAQLQELQANRKMPDIMPLDQAYVDLPDLDAGLKNIAVASNFSGEFHFRHDEEAANAADTSVERAGVAQLKNLPWFVIVGESEEKLLAPVEVQTRGTLLIGILATLFAIVFAYISAWYLTTPITRLSGIANRLAGGDLSARSPELTKDEVGRLAVTFNTMAEQLETMVSSLEQRVADRTRALTTSTEVSRRLSTILNVNQLVEEVVEQIQLSFNYYHVHIYLFDETKTNLMMVGGSGEAGQVMLARGHSIPRGKGLVGRAAETVSPVLVKDVTRSPGWLPNPLLPDTKSELAVPIAVSDNVLGVLDVQQDRVEGLQEEDADLLQSIANQIAVALQNSRSYSEAQRRASREALISAISQRILSTSSPEEALQVAAREVGRALGTDSVYVKLGERKNGQS